jgi:hypothetical protein
MKLQEVFREVSNQMRSDFRRAQQSLSHSGLKGDANEDTVRRFLRQYLPRTLDVISGTLVDSSGSHSRQLDVVLSDTAKTPVFFQAGDNRVIPVECAYSVIEVKANLDTQELKRCFDNMRSCKSLKKHAYFQKNSPIIETHTLYGKEWAYFPLSYFVFAFDSISIPSLLQNLDQYHAGCEVHERIDTICVLDQGVILNQSKTGFYSCLPEADSRLTACLTDQALLLFYAVISIILSQARMPNFNIHPYLQNMAFGPSLFPRK